MRQGDHEHLSFEKFAEASGLDREMHPLHLLYLNSDTQKALDAFKAGYDASKINAVEHFGSYLIDDHESKFIGGETQIQALCTCVLEQINAN